MLTDPRLSFEDRWGSMLDELLVRARISGEAPGHRFDLGRSCECAPIRSKIPGDAECPAWVAHELWLGVRALRDRVVTRESRLEALPGRSVREILDDDSPDPGSVDELAAVAAFNQVVAVFDGQVDEYLNRLAGWALAMDHAADEVRRNDLPSPHESPLSREEMARAERRITELSRAAWSRIRDTAPARRPDVEAGIRAWYGHVGAPAPETIFWVRSPREMSRLVRALTEVVSGSWAALVEARGDVVDSGIQRFRGSLMPETYEHAARYLAAASRRTGTTARIVESVHPAAESHLVSMARAASAVFGWNDAHRLRRDAATRLGGARSRLMESLAWWDTASERPGLGSGPIETTDGTPRPVDTVAALPWLGGLDEAGLAATHAVLEAADSTASAWCWWGFRGFAIACERPAQIQFDDQRRLHAHTGPAIRFRDGWAVSAWHGTPVPHAAIDSGWTPRDILASGNQEVRRAAIEASGGWHEFARRARLQQVGPDVADPGNPGGDPLRLYELPHGLLDEPARLLLVSNASLERDGSRRRYGLLVPPDIDDPLDAAAWTFDLDPALYASLDAAR